VPVNLITNTFAAILLFAWLAHVKAKQTTPPALRGAIAFAVPLAQAIFYYNMGIKEEVTLGEISFLSAPLGIGELVLALNYHLHHG